jgi:hypothetical protein
MAGFGFYPWLDQLHHGADHRLQGPWRIITPGDL